MHESAAYLPLSDDVDEMLALSASFRVDSSGSEAVVAAEDRKLVLTNRDRVGLIFMRVLSFLFRAKRSVVVPQIFL